MIWKRGTYIDAGAGGGGGGAPAGGAPPGGGGTPAGSPGAQGGPGGRPAGGASAEVRQLMGHPAYSDAKHPEHRAIVERVNARYKDIFGDAPYRPDDETSAGAEGKPLYAAVPRPSLPADVESAWPAATEAVLRKEAHAAGLTDRQVGHFLEVLAKGASAAHARRQTEIKAGFEALRSKWGPNFDRNLAFARKAVNAFDPSIAAALDKSGLGNHPAFAEVFFALGEAMKDRGLVLGDVDAIQGGDEAKRELNRLMRSDAYFDSNHRNHKAVVDAVNRLAKKVWGEGRVNID